MLQSNPEFVIIFVPVGHLCDSLAIEDFHPPLKSTISQKSDMIFQGKKVGWIWHL